MTCIRCVDCGHFVKKYYRSIPDPTGESDWEVPVCDYCYDQRREEEEPRRLCFGEG